MEVGIFVTALDIAASVIMEAPATRLLHHLLMTLYFVCVELVIVQWFQYVITLLFPENSKGSKAASYTLPTPWR